MGEPGLVFEESLRNQTWAFPGWVIYVRPREIITLVVGSPVKSSLADALPEAIAGLVITWSYCKGIGRLLERPTIH